MTMLHKTIPSKTIQLKRIIKPPTDLERITRILAGEKDDNPAILRLKSLNSATMIKILTVKSENNEIIEFLITDFTNYNFNLNFIEIGPGELWTFQNVFIGKNSILECRARPMKREVSFPDLAFVFGIEYVGTLEVIDE